MLFMALFLASCALLPSTPGNDEPAIQSAPVETMREDRKEPRKPKAKPIAPAPVPQPSAPVTVQAQPMSPVAHCAALDAGNLKDTINAKLDCIKESAK
jgi:hypothetical protein